MKRWGQWLALLLSALFGFWSYRVTVLRNLLDPLSYRTHPYETLAWNVENASLLIAMWIAVVLPILPPINSGGV
ncbi:MAG: hypothetical protein ACREC3_12440, partial [Methyloceanibacter sp.]